MTKVRPTTGPQILHILSGDLWGGAEAQVCLQLQALKDAGVSVQALLLNHGEVEEAFRERGLRTRVIPESYGLKRLCADSLDFVSNDNPTLIHSHGYKSGILSAWLSWQRKIPWVSTIHGLTESYSGWAHLKMQGYQVLHTLLQKLLCSRIITVSQNIAIKLGLENHPRQLTLYNVGPSFSASAASVSAERYIVVVGRLAPVKRVDIAIRSFAKLLQANPEGSANLSLWIVGTGPEEQALISLASDELAGRVRFLGFQAKPLELIAHAEALLITSDSEGIPTVILEAIALGTPVVASRVGGIPEIFALVPTHPHEVVERQDIAGFAAALTRTLSASRELERHSETQRLYTENFSPEQAAKKLLAIYSAVEQERNSPSL